MITKEQLKSLIDQLPEDKVPFIENFINSLLLKNERVKPPTGKLGLKEPFNRGDLYDEILADRY
jgi:hypothetical protein